MLGNLSGSTTQTLKGYYSKFPCLKHFFLCEGGTGTYSAVDIVGGLKMYNLPWTGVDFKSSRMDIVIGAGAINPDDMGIGHNHLMDEGHWHDPGRKSSIWLICGKFQTSGTTGFDFGFGTSVPAGREVVLSVQPNLDVWANWSIAGSTYLPVGGVSTTKLTEGVTSLIGFIIDEEKALATVFHTTADGSFSGDSLPFTEEAFSLINTYPGPAFPPGYSMVTSSALEASGAGADELSAIVCFSFKDGIPEDYIEALEWMRTEWDAGRKHIWPAWEGITGATDRQVLPDRGTLDLTVDSSSAITINVVGADHPDGIAQYDFYRYQSGGYVLIGSSATPSFQDTGLSAATAYQYAVRIWGREYATGPHTWSPLAIATTDP